MKTALTSFVAIMLLVTIGSCKKDDQEKTEDLLKRTWTYKRTESTWNGPSQVVNSSGGGEWIKFNSDMTFEINSTYLMGEISHTITGTCLPSGTYAISGDGKTITLFGKGITAANPWGGPENVDNFWENGLVISEINGSKLSFSQTYTTDLKTFYFEK